MNKKLLLLFTIALFALIGKATHITHGNVYYEYLGRDANNDNRYQISVVVYRDCKASTVAFDDEIDIGIYRKNKSLFLSGKVFLTDTTTVTPFFLTDNSGDFCFRKARYVTIIALPADTGGYHVVWNRCCRNNVTNIIEDNSAAYYAFIPGKINNGPAPNFDGIISMRAGQWYNLSATHTDKDADTLTYTLTAPLNGQAESGNPVPSPPATIVIPVSTIKYKSGFSAQKPLGNTGSFIVYAKNGGIKLYSATQGVYIVGIKVSEWRDGVLLAEHYREISIYCYANAVQGDAVRLRGNAAEGKKIQLTWTYSINPAVNNMVLRRRTEHDTTWKNIGLFDSTGFHYTDTVVQADSLYWYQVTANTGFTSVQSNIVKISLNPNVWPTGINSPEKPEFTAYPNPVNDKLFINDEKNNISSLIITDISGRMLYETADMEGIKSKGLHTGFLPAGIYVLQAATPDGIQTLRIIKQ